MLTREAHRAREQRGWWRPCRAQAASSAVRAVGALPGRASPSHGCCASGPCFSGCPLTAEAGSAVGSSVLAVVREAAWHSILLPWLSHRSPEGACPERGTVICYPVLHHVSITSALFLLFIFHQGGL